MTLLEKLLVATVLLQVALTFGVLWWLGRARLPLLARGEIKLADIAVDSSAWPLKAQQISNNFSNQFQLPVLFYVAAVLLLSRLGVDWLSVVLAAVFVVSRYLHAFIHGTSNALRQRFATYVAGMMVLLLLWLWIGAKALILAPAL